MLLYAPGLSRDAKPVQGTGSCNDKGRQVPKSPGQVSKLETQERGQYISGPSLKAWEPGEPVVWFLPEGRPVGDLEELAFRRKNPFYLRGRLPFCCIQGFAAVWGLPTLERAICFIQSITSTVNLIPKHPYGSIQANVWPHIRPPRGHMKSTVTDTLLSQIPYST